MYAYKAGALRGIQAPAFLMGSTSIRVITPPIIKTSAGSYSTAQFDTVAGTKLLVLTALRRTAGTPTASTITDDSAGGPFTWISATNTPFDNSAAAPFCRIQAWTASIAAIKTGVTITMDGNNSNFQHTHIFEINNGASTDFSNVNIGVSTNGNASSIITAPALTSLEILFAAINAAGAAPTGTPAGAIPLTTQTNGFGLYSQAMYRSQSQGTTDAWTSAGSTTGALAMEIKYA